MKRLYNKNPVSYKRGRKLYYRRASALPFLAQSTTSRRPIGPDKDEDLLLCGGRRRLRCRRFQPSRSGRQHKRATPWPNQPPTQSLSRSFLPLGQMPEGDTRPRPAGHQPPPPPPPTRRPCRAVPLLITPPQTLLSLLHFLENPAEGGAKPHSSSPLPSSERAAAAAAAPGELLDVIRIILRGGSASGSSRSEAAGIFPLPRIGDSFAGEHLPPHPNHVPHSSYHPDPLLCLVSSLIV